MSQINHTDEAVSPVVGIMLMLVVTIIIAAVVSTMAGGLMTSTDAAPQVAFSVSSTVEKISDSDMTNAQPDSPSPAVNGILFRHTGGDTISLDAIKIQLSSSNKQMTFTMDTVQSASSIVPSVYPVVKNGEDRTYFSVGNKESITLNAGDSVLLLADSCYDSTKASDTGIAKGQYLSWQPSGSAGTFTAQVGDTISYSIIDVKSGHAIQNGVVRIQ